MATRAVLAAVVAAAGCSRCSAVALAAPLAPKPVHKRRARGSEVTFVTVETRSPDSSIPVPGVEGKSFINLGKNRTWENLFTKPKLFLAWLKLRRDPEGIVVFADAEDSMHGGCSDGQLLDAYRRVVQASGGVRAVMGAEMGLDPPPVGALVVDPRAQFAQRRQDVQRSFSLSDSSYGSIALCSNVLVQTTKAQAKKCYVPAAEEVRALRWPCPGPCSWPPSLTYLNSGFIMGPVRNLIEVVTGLLQYEELPGDTPYRTRWHDQGAAILYMSHNPGKLTLDYSGSLVLNLHQLPLGDVIDVYPDRLKNRITGQTACFIHANGPALLKLNRTLAAMHQSKIGEPVTF